MVRLYELLPVWGCDWETISGLALREGQRLRARMDALERWPQRWLAPERSKNHQRLIWRFTIKGSAIII